jgi:hypothetical protein
VRSYTEMRSLFTLLVMRVVWISEVGSLVGGLLDHFNVSIKKTPQRENTPSTNLSQREVKHYAKTTPNKVKGTGLCFRCDCDFVSTLRLDCVFFSNGSRKFRKPTNCYKSSG